VSEEEQDLVAEAISKLELACKRLEQVTYNAKADGALRDVHSALAELKAFQLEREALKA
jgi:hypothetical protein